MVPISDDHRFLANLVFCAEIVKRTENCMPDEVMTIRCPETGKFVFNAFAQKLAE
jgi:hypothetical protein